MQRMIYNYRSEFTCLRKMDSKNYPFFLFVYSNYDNIAKKEVYCNGRI